MKKLVLTLVVVLCNMLLLLGCANGYETGKRQMASVFIAGVHSNSFKIPFNASLITEGLYNTCYTYGDVSFINVDADPIVFYQTRILPPKVNGLSEEKLDAIASEYTTQLQQILATAAPRVEEADTLKAIQKAAQALKGVDENTTDKVLVILDSGLSTSGYLDFTKGLLNAEVTDIVNALREEMAIPDLKEVNVVWAFCGEAAPPQKELNEKEKAKLKDIWEEILLAANAKTVTFSDDFTSMEEYSGLPKVSTVETNQVEMDIKIEEALETVVLDNTSIQFVGDKAEFVNREVAESNIRILAEQLMEHPNNKVYVIGTTASGSADFCNRLSMERAQAVVDVLIGMGIPEEQLVPMGLGYEDPWHVDDLDTNGRLIEDKAFQNRKVLIVDVNGDDAAQLN